MCKKYLIITILIFGIFVQISFADRVKFESTSKGKDGKPVMLTGLLTVPEGEGPFPAIVLLMQGCDGNRDTTIRNKGIDEIYGSHKFRYDPEAAKDAINQVKSFLAKHLAPKDEEIDKAVYEPFDLSGTWIVTDDWSGCNRSKIDKWTVEISQKDEMLRLVNIDRNNSYSGVINDSLISVNGFEYPSRGGPDATNTVHDYTLKIGPNANTLSGKAKWTWRSKKGTTCGGISNLTFERKLKD